MCLNEWFWKYCLSFFDKLVPIAIGIDTSSDSHRVRWIHHLMYHISQPNPRIVAAWAGRRQRCVHCDRLCETWCSLNLSISKSFNLWKLRFFRKIYFRKFCTWESLPIPPAPIEAKIWKKIDIRLRVFLIFLGSIEIGVFSIKTGVLSIKTGVLNIKTSWRLALNDSFFPTKPTYRRSLSLAKA